MQGDKEITARDGKKDIAWRTDVLDTLIEVLLVERYRIFTDIQQEAAVGCGDWQEEHFWGTLSLALDEDYGSCCMRTLRFRGDMEKA